MSTASFIPGLELSRRLAKALEPGLRSAFPDLPLALAFIGPGSDVLGFDTSRSMDHDWGPRVSVVVPSPEIDMVRRRFDELSDMLLPSEIAGFPTRVSWHPDDTAKLDATGSEHRVHITSVERLIQSTLSIDGLDRMNDAVWLSTPMQSLLEITAGEVFLDDTGELTDLRNKLAFYPDHILRFQLAGLWMRVSQVQPFIGRCFEVGDQVGAETVLLGIVRDFMRIGLLQSRRYAPYAKWLGTAFARSEVVKHVSSDLDAAVQNPGNYAVLEVALNRAGSELIRQLNSLELIPEIDQHAFQFWDRPYMVLPAERIALLLKESVAGSGLHRFDQVLGGIDVITDSTDALTSSDYRKAVRRMFTLG